MTRVTVDLGARAGSEPAGGTAGARETVGGTASVAPFPCPVFQDRRRHPAVIVLPGGAYAFTTPREGAVVARMFNLLDCAAFVLEYSAYDRDPGTTTARLLGEVRGAIDLVRERADAWHVDPDRVYLCGFSAGGHLAALAGNAYPALLAGVILCYPALDLKEHRIELAGADPDALMRLFAPRPIEGVTPETPPTFLWHTRDDEVAPVAASLEYLLRLVEHGVPCEAHLYGRGPHGLSLATRASARAPELVDDHVAGWTRLVAEWIRTPGARRPPR